MLLDTSMFKKLAVIIELSFHITCIGHIIIFL
jgi:hypothetical protein